MKWSQKAFTLVELIVAVVISSIILVVVFSYVSETMRAISYSLKVSEFMTSYQDFTTQLDNYRKIYDYNEIVIDNAKWDGNDVLLLTNWSQESWVLFGVVNAESMQLERNVLYPIYNDKIIWYRELTQQDIIDIDSDAQVVYDYDFFRDKVFEDIKMKDFQALLFNSWSLVDLNLYVNMDYLPWLNGSDFIDISDEYIEKFNINF